VRAPGHRPRLSPGRGRSSQLLGRIGDRWTVLIVGALEEQERRFGQLLSHVSGISAKVSTQTPCALERDGLVKREIFPEIPPRVEYSLTELGRELVDRSRGSALAVAHMERVISARELYDARPAVLPDRHQLTRPHPRAPTQTTRPGAFGFLHCSLRLRVEKTGRDRGVRKAPRFLPSPCLQIGADVSPNLRVLMFASAAGGDALKQDDTRHGAWGCRVRVSSPMPTQFGEATLSSGRGACRPHGRNFRRASSPRERRAVRTAVRAQEAGCEPGGPVSTVGTYSSSWSLPSNVRLATISRVTSGYPS